MKGREQALMSPLMLTIHKDVTGNSEQMIGTNINIILKPHSAAGLICAAHPGSDPLGNEQVATPDEALEVHSSCPISCLLSVSSQRRCETEISPLLLRFVLCQVSSMCDSQLKNLKHISQSQH